MSDLTFSDSIDVAAPPADVYALVSDVTRTGEWSPICRECTWDDGDGPRVGAWFTGRNETAARTWETRSQVTVAEPEREFAFEVGQGFVRWSYRCEPVDGGTRLTESWHFLPAGIAMFHEKYADQAQTEIDERTAAAHSSIPATLAAIKHVAERGDA
ncbi:MAG: SRPBCC family protein [Terracoccus sp.]